MTGKNLQRICFVSGFNFYSDFSSVLFLKNYFLGMCNLLKEKKHSASAVLCPESSQMKMMDRAWLWSIDGNVKWYVWVSEVAQSCPTLYDPMDCSLPGSSIHGIFQARVLEWVAMSFSRGSSQPRDWIWVSRIAGRCFTVWATAKPIKWYNL